MLEVEVTWHEPCYAWMGQDLTTAGCFLVGWTGKISSLKSSVLRTLPCKVLHDILKGKQFVKAFHIKQRTNEHGAVVKFKPPSCFVWWSIPNAKSYNVSPSRIIRLWWKWWRPAKSWMMPKLKKRPDENWKLWASFKQYAANDLTADVSYL